MGGYGVIQVSMGTSSSEVVSSDSGMSSTSSSEEDEEDEENEGEAERGMELVEGEGEALNREMLRPSVWKMEAREGLLGGTATGGVLGAAGLGAGGAYGGGGGDAPADSGGRGGGAPCCSDRANRPSF